MQTVVAHSSERMKSASDFTKNLAASKKRKDESGSLEKGRIEYPGDGWTIFEHGSSWSVFVDGRRIRIHSSSTTMRCQMVKPDCPYHHTSPILILDEMNYKLASLHVLHSISDRSRISREKRKREKFWKQFSKFVMCILKKEWKNLLSLVAIPRFDLVRFVA